MDERGIIENKYSTDVEYPPSPPPRVCMSGHTQDKSCFDIDRLLDLDDPPARRLTYTAVGVDDEGLVNPADVAAAVTPLTCLVTIMHANNEVGAVGPDRHCSPHRPVHCQPSFLTNKTASFDAASSSYQALALMLPPNSSNAL